ncbi:hypothetical protein G7K_2079-t1 [Saitoella complicata NRRL Y-17804]|uniref:Uncharacterized protein n=1 Tax=Saitoella complicata (strain BCRC 22490 / CBS 7301 / JCM 7358 / NBRC 10748 / NRRL Y-17804) TaxID=698492 RepID=A0A0E9NDK9_SAICN|nr:hypothetical protein G7K_2079-t1 [Saitoella complicata NRRL Y-17804]
MRSRLCELTRLNRRTPRTRSDDGHGERSRPATYASYIRRQPRAPRCFPRPLYVAFPVAPPFSLGQSFLPIK